MKLTRNTKNEILAKLFNVEEKQIKLLKTIFCKDEITLDYLYSFDKKTPDTELMENPFQRVISYVRACYNPPALVELKMALFNVILGGFGTESILGEYVDRYWQNCQAIYVNMGDTYTSTILYDVEKKSFYVMSYGDWIEEQEKDGKIFD